MIISLTGMPGSGKTTVGRALAARLGWRFTDLDEYVEHKAGRSVSEIFAADGEQVFRALEAEAVRDRLVMSRIEGFDLVLSLGGGTLGIGAVRPFILSGTRCICLDASPDTIIRRISADPVSRPLLSSPDAVAGLAASRAALYSAVPEHICTDGLSVDEVVGAICLKI